MQHLLSLLFFLFTCPIVAQGYFQQKVDYKIEVRLDDEADEITGTLDLSYTNNSPDILDQIPFHIWPNAYSSSRSAFARQQLRNGSTDFHFSRQTERGGLDQLEFTVDGTPVSYTLDSIHPDIVYLPIVKGMQPGQTIQIRTPFRVDIPESFSRLGHVEDSYQMSQWYPKPAVYDQDGWHAMPYLDQGEFYSEFGDFEVSITLPENYVVGATGVLQQQAEIDWLKEKAAAYRKSAPQQRSDFPDPELEETPSSSVTMKTLTYRAEQVHDFAWFADKNFRVLHDQVTLPGKAEPVDIWSMFTAREAYIWQRSAEYLKRAVGFYSKHVGTYPYPQVTAVQSALSAGGGMEYPMITVIGLSGTAKSLDQVLTHEVGHNWFYGILGSNERDHAWMDEGLNSYYEGRYMDTYYEEPELELPLVGVLDINRTGYLYYARQGKDQAPDTPSDSLSEWNYLIQSYSKPAQALQEVEVYAGVEKLDAAMQAYYQEWKFRHPQPQDFFTLMEREIPGISPWFPDALMTNHTSDWKVGKLADGPDGDLTLLHSGQRLAPAAAQMEKEDGGRDTILVPPNTAAETQVATNAAIRATLPERLNPLDLYEHNNRSGWRPRRLGIGIGTETAEKAPIFVTPLAGYNIHDGLQAGFTLHNRTFAPKKFEWLLAPLYGFKSGGVNGFGGAQYRVARPFDGVRQLMLSGGTQRWSDFTLALNEEAFSYDRTALRATIFFDHPLVTQRESALFAQVIRLRSQRPLFADRGQLIGEARTTNLFYRVGYERSINREISPRHYAVTLEFKDKDPENDSPFEATHLRLDATADGGYQYEKGKFLRWRLFAAYFIVNDLRERTFFPSTGISLIDNSDSDYRRDGLFFGRNNFGGSAVGWVDAQLGRQQGGFRVPVGSAFAGQFRSNSYLGSVNLDVDLPTGVLPLGVFIDAAYFDNRSTLASPNSGNFRWVGGASLSVAEGRIGVFAPFVFDPDTKLLMEQRGGILNRLTFRLQLEGWVPWKWLDDIF